MAGHASHSGQRMDKAGLVGEGTSDDQKSDQEQQGKVTQEPTIELWAEWLGTASHSKVLRVL